MLNIEKNFDRESMPKLEETIESKSIFYIILPILLCGLSIPLSLFLWIGNLAFTFVTQRPNEGMNNSEQRFL